MEIPVSVSEGMRMASEIVEHLCYVLICDLRGCLKHALGEFCDEFCKGCHISREEKVVRCHCLDAVIKPVDCGGMGNLGCGLLAVGCWRIGGVGNTTY